VPILEIVKMDDEELYVPDDALEETSAASYQNFAQTITITLPELEKFTDESKPMSERQ
jgi:hypothetical protein